MLKWFLFMNLNHLFKLPLRSNVSSLFKPFFSLRVPWHQSLLFLVLALCISILYRLSLVAIKCDVLGVNEWLLSIHNDPILVIFNLKVGRFTR